MWVVIFATWRQLPIRLPVKRRQPRLLTVEENYEATHFPPIEENLGKNCQYWDGSECRCAFVASSKTGFSTVAGRYSCEGMIDDVCLLRLHGRIIGRLSMVENVELLAQPATYNDNRGLPKGEAE